MLTGLWTIGVKVPDLERELTFHRSMGNVIVLDEILVVNGQPYRIPLVKMGDKYMHLAEKMVYEDVLGQNLAYGPTHLVYKTDDFQGDYDKAMSSGATEIMPVTNVSAGFGERRVAFFRAPGQWIFEIIEISKHLVPDV